MNSTQILAVCLGIVIVLAVYREISGKYKAWSARQDAERAKEQARAESMAASMAALEKSMNAASQAGIDSAKLLAGTLKACEAVAASTTGLRDVVSEFSKLVGAPKREKGYPEDNFSPPATESDAQRTATFIEALGRGVPIDQAMQEAKEAEEKKTMLSAISFGPADEN